MRRDERSGPPRVRGGNHATRRGAQPIVGETAAYDQRANRVNRVDEPEEPGGHRGDSDPAVMTGHPPRGDPGKTHGNERGWQCQRTSKSRHATELHLSKVARTRCLGTGSTLATARPRSSVDRAAVS